MGTHVLGVVDGTPKVRVGPDLYAQLLSKPHVRTMDFTGKPMKGFVYVDPAGFESDASLASWEGSSVGFAGSLPPNK